MSAWGYLAGISFLSRAPVKKLLHIIPLNKVNEMAHVLNDKLAKAEWNQLTELVWDHSNRPDSRCP